VLLPGCFRSGAFLPGDDAAGGSLLVEGERSCAFVDCAPTGIHLMHPRCPMAECQTLRALGCIYTPTVAKMGTSPRCRRESHDAHRPRRIGLRSRDPRPRRQRGSASREAQKISAGKFHIEPPFTSFDHLVGAGEQCHAGIAGPLSGANRKDG
jgi:hypothetical protein